MNPDFNLRPYFIIGLIAAVLLGVGMAVTGYYVGRGYHQPTVDRLRADSTKLANTLDVIKQQKEVAEGYMNRYDAEIQTLTLERKADREQTDSTLYRILRMSPDAAKRAVIDYYQNRQNGGG